MAKSYPQVINNRKKPLISIILPIFNREQFLKETIESILIQSFQDFELLIINDGSIDRSVNIVDFFKQSYPQKIYCFTQPNKGVSSARNLGISKARGKYIAFIDSDDLWIKTKLEEQLAFMEQKKVAVCQTDETWIRNGKRVNHMKKHTKHSGNIFFDSLPLCIVSPSAVMIKKEVLDKVGCFDTRLPVVEDYDLWLRISLFYPIYLYPKKLIVKKGGHADQLSRKYWGMDRFRIYSMRKLLKQHAEHLSLLQKTALYWWIKEKAAIISSGAWKRKNFLLYLKYGYLFSFYYIKWNNI
ncbi:MAG: glycosyltransferase [Candidatus Margulisbacteria bacterium]|nr:glycosyltransferase [Candidatus Margulisiibacteriota bacterium]